MLYKILTVAGLATFEIYAAIPAGFAFKLNPWIIFTASLVGGITGAFVAAFLGDRIKKLLQNLENQNKNLKKKSHHWLIKFGINMALLA